MLMNVFIVQLHMLFSSPQWNMMLIAHISFMQYGAAVIPYFKSQLDGSHNDNNHFEVNILNSDCAF